MGVCSARVWGREGLDWIKLVRIIKITLTSLILMIPAPIAAQDFDKGLAAFDSGDTGAQTTYILDKILAALSVLGQKQKM
jgi:hypothetical protein